MVKDHLRLDRSASISLGVLLGCSHGLAIAALFAADLALFHKFTFTFSVLVSFVFCLNRYCLLRDPLSVLVVVFNNGVWRLELKSSEQITARLEFPVFVNRYLVVMNFRDAAGRKFPVAVFADGAEVTQMRHLRIFLKLGMAQPNVGGTRMVSLGVSSNRG